MADDQSSSQNTKGSTQETSDQGTSISFDFEGAARRKNIRRIISRFHRQTIPKDVMQKE